MSLFDQMEETKRLVQNHNRNSTVGWKGVMMCDVRMCIGFFFLQTDMIKAHCFIHQPTILHEEKMASAPAYQQPAPVYQQLHAMQDSRYIIILIVFLHNDIYIYI